MKRGPSLVPTSRVPVRWVPSWWKRHGEAVCACLILAGIALGIIGAFR